MELKYSGVLDGTQVCGRVLYSSSIQEGLIELKYTGGLMELKYTGGLDGTQVCGRV